MSHDQSWGEPLTLAAAGRQHWPNPDFIFGPLQPGDVGLISGSDGVGKSFLTLTIAATVGLGISAGKIFTPGRHTRKVLIITGEDRRDDHGRRLKALYKQLEKDGVVVRDDDDSVTLLPLTGKRKPLIEKSGEGYRTTPHAEIFKQQLKEYGLTFVDPLRMFHDLQENDGPGMDFLIRWFVETAMEIGVTIILVHHASQGAILDGREDHHAGRGATDLPAGCRAVWTIRRMSKEEAKVSTANDKDRRDWRVLANGKANHGEEDGKIWLKRGDGGVLYCPGHSPLDKKKEDSQDYAQGKSKRNGAI